MEVTFESLKQRFVQEETEELLLHHSAGTLSSDGYDAVEYVLKERGIRIPDRPKDIIHVEKSNSIFSNKYLLVTITIIAFISWSMFRGNERENRLNQAVDQSLQTIGSKAYKDYLNGKEISATDFVVAASQIVKESNYQLPMAIDETTTIILVDLKNKSLIYNYELNVNKNTIDLATFRDDTFTRVKQLTCTDDVTAFFLKHNINVTYSYSINGKPFTSITITNKNCV